MTCYLFVIFNYIWDMGRYFIAFVILNIVQYLELDINEVFYESKCEVDRQNATDGHVRNGSRYPYGWRP
ncbi:protein of unknown function [Moritella yayanosii]|uniref:Uncharacterized protein n=1 Tax=Moritella yayanosii TaxID=69539 RepID=A0A330LSG0_9GAMM|nr:protein of unknown function [Moritella yayanosii]